MIFHENELVKSNKFFHLQNFIFMPIKNVLLDILTNTAEELEEVSIEDALQHLHDSDPETWKRVTDDLIFASGKIKVKGKFVTAMVEGIGIAAQESIDANPEKGIDNNA